MFRHQAYNIMKDVIEPPDVPDKDDWRSFFSLLIILFFAMMVSAQLPTPGSWSDGRSQWLPPAAIAITTVCLFVATFRIYRRPGVLSKIQSVILWLIFGVVLIAAIDSLYESWLFLREVGPNY
jgi:hypothetical protein